MKSIFAKLEAVVALTAIVVMFIAVTFAAPAAQAQHQHEQPHDGHLSFVRDNTHARLFWEQKPTLANEGVLRIEFMNGNLHKPTNIEAQVAVELWMPLHNHGSAPALLERIADSKGTFDTAVYRASQLNFVMEGEWEVRVTLTYADGTSEMQPFDVLIQ